MEEIFVTKLRINKVRHLEKLEIPLSDTERKHLILTGKNGSGKTSVMNALSEMINYFVDEQTGIERMYEAYLRSEASVQLALTKREIKVEEQNDLFQKLIEKNYPIFLKLFLFFNSNSQMNVRKEGLTEDFLFYYFPARRTPYKMVEPKTVEKIEKGDIRRYDDRFNKYFIQYLLNLKVERSFANEENDFDTVFKIDKWFANFELALKSVFSDSELRFKFIRKPYNFFILQKNRELSNLNQLSDGYSSIIDMISELIMRMENKVSQVYDLQGIVLIDEIETHLHIDLQKKILPFLTSFFPKIQFIVTTHSPFVLSSIDNAVIYDLEKQQRIEDLSDYSYQELVETYFGTDQYSDYVKQKLNEYEVLIQKENHTEDDEDKLYEIRKYFRKLPFFLSPELQLKIQSLELYSQNSQV